MTARALAALLLLCDPAAAGTHSHLRRDFPTVCRLRWTQPPVMMPCRPLSEADIPPATKQEE